MPILPDKALSQFIKPDTLLLDVGEKMTFTITGPHAEGKGNDMYSIPVRAMGELKSPDLMKDGYMGLNKTHAGFFVKKLGRDTDLWKGAQFTALVNLGRNPQSNTQVKTWTVIESTITPAKKK